MLQRKRYYKLIPVLMLLLLLSSLVIKSFYQQFDPFGKKTCAICKAIGDLETADTPQAVRIEVPITVQLLAARELPNCYHSPFLILQNSRDPPLSRS